MKSRKLLFSIITLCFLFNHANILQTSFGQVILTSEEYSSGTISTTHPFMLYYTWINTSEKSLISLNTYDNLSKEAYFNPFFGNYFNLDNDSYFIGTMLTGFELYRDKNSNQVLDQTDELDYYIVLNCSKVFEIQEVVKDSAKESYSWNVTYGDIEGSLYPYVNGNRTVVNISGIEMNYNLEIKSNYTELTMEMGMGKWSNATHFSWNDTGQREEEIRDIDLTNYSISMLYGNTISSEKSLNISKSNGSNDTSTILISVNDIPVFQSVFQDTYELEGEKASSLSSIVNVENESISTEQISDWASPLELYNWWHSFYPGMKEISAPSLNLEKANYLYRVCYPEWGGKQLYHAPRYKAYTELTEIPSDDISSEVQNTTQETTLNDTSVHENTSFLFIDVMVLGIVCLIARKRIKIKK